jgi:hypothetical protein
MAYRSPPQRTMATSILHTLAVQAPVAPPSTPALPQRHNPSECEKPRPHPSRAGQLEQTACSSALTPPYIKAPYGVSMCTCLDPVKCAECGVRPRQDPIFQSCRAASRPRPRPRGARTSRCPAGYSSSRKSERSHLHHAGLTARTVCVCEGAAAYCSVYCQGGRTFRFVFKFRWGAVASHWLLRSLVTHTPRRPRPGTNKWKSEKI